MMSLLSVTVKKARFVGAQASQLNTYVTLKLQNVKSTTVTVKGSTPCWEQDFLFETNDLNTGLLIEAWSKGMIWDRAMGYHWIPLQTVQYSNEEGSGQWVQLEAELLMRDGEVVGTKSPTGHSLLVDCRFELPFDPENIEASDLQRKLEMLNNIMDQEARQEQARRQMQYFGQSGYSEDSDYTSDLNYPVGQHANSSASQFRSAAHQMHTPQRSLETSRENSYERDDAQHHLPTPGVATANQRHLSPGSHRRLHQRFSPGTMEEEYNSYGSNLVENHNIRQYQQDDNNADSDPLFYNSRPRNKPECLRAETWGTCNSSFYNQSVDSVDVGYSIDSEYFDSQTTTSKARRPSLERQTTLYDDSPYYGDPMYYPNDNVTKVNCVMDISSQPFNQSCEEYFDSLSYPFQEDRFGLVDEDRQWDSGGGYAPPPPKITPKRLPAVPLQAKPRPASSAAFYDDMGYDDAPFRSTPTPRRKMPQIPTSRGSVSRQSSVTDGYDNSPSRRGASLPPTPTKTPKMLPKVQAMQARGFNSLPPTPGRQLPRPNTNHRSAKARLSNLKMKRTSSAEYNDMDSGSCEYGSYYMRPGAVSARDYNEDYNYAYQSIDNLPEEEDFVDQGVPYSAFNHVNSKSDAVKSGTLPYQSQSIDDYYYDSSGAQPQDYYQDAYNNEQNNQISSLAVMRPTQPTTVIAATSAATSINVSAPKTAVPTFTTPAATTAMQYNHRDQNQAIPSTISTTATSLFNNLKAIVAPAQVPNRGVLKPQDSIVDMTYMNNNNLEYLEPQESIESYIEEEDEDEEPLEESHMYKNTTSTQNHDSPSSVIHVGQEELRRGSSQITVVDTFHSSLQQQRPSDPYAPLASRRTSDPYSHRDDFLPASTGRKPSIADGGGGGGGQYLNLAGVGGANNRRASLGRASSPPLLHHADEHPEDGVIVKAGVILEDVVEDEGEVPEKKSVSFEEEEQTQPRPKATAKQRWLWAYNKIIMQLNILLRKTKTQDQIDLMAFITRMMPA